MIAILCRVPFFVVVASLLACSDENKVNSNNQDQAIHEVSSSNINVQNIDFNLAQKVAYTIWNPVNDINSVNAQPYLQQADLASLVVLSEVSEVWSYDGDVAKDFTDSISVSGYGTANGKVIIDFDDYAFTDTDIRLLDGRVTLNMNLENVYEAGPELTNWNRLKYIDFQELLVSGAQAFVVNGRMTEGKYASYPGTSYNLAITNVITREVVSFDDLVVARAYDVPNYFYDGNLVTGAIHFAELGTISISPTEISSCESCSSVEAQNYLALELSLPESNATTLIFKPSAKKVRLSFGSVSSDLLLNVSSILESPVEHVAPKIGTINFKESDVLEQLLIAPLSIQDEDGDLVSVAYEWRVNGTWISAADNQLSLGREYFVGGDNVEFTVIASDDFHYAERSVDMLVPNTLPRWDEELFESPLTMVIGDTIELDASAAVDPDGEALVYEWAMTNSPWVRGDGLSFAPSSDSASVTATAVSQGEHSVNLRIYDNSGSIWKYGTVNIEAMDLFEECYDIDVSGSDLELVLIEDINNDGREDLVIGLLPGSSMYNEAGLLTYIQQVDGTLGSPRFYAAGFTSHAYHMDAIDSGDFNGDGRTDIVTTHADGVAIWYQASTGVLSGPDVKVPFGGFGYSELIAGDFDGNLLDDILSFHNSSYSELIKQYNDHSLSSSIPIALGLGGYRTPNKKAADMDNDGLVDIITWSSYPEKHIHSYELPGSGIEHKVLYEFGDDVPKGALEVVDINKDDLKDILINLEKETEPNYVIAILLQDEAGSFNITQALDFYISNEVDQIQTGDFNGDGRIDIAAVTGGWPSLYIYLQLEDGRFMSQQSYPITFNSGDRGKLSVGDLNSDGKDDAVIVNQSTIQIYYGK